MHWTISAIFALLLAGCAAQPPSPQDLQAKRFEPVADKSVVYLYRDPQDFSDSPATFMLDGQQQGTTYQGTYYRLEIPSGRHRIAGFAGDSGLLDFETAPGRLYFIRHAVSWSFAFPRSVFQLVSEAQGRDGVYRAELQGAR